MLTYDLRPLSPQDRERYSRQILFPGIGLEGQTRLRDSHVAIIGCGALGTYHAAALARAGVGRLSIFDRDFVESSNLQRQWLFTEEDAAEALPKAAAASRQLARINSGITVDAHARDITAANIEELIGSPNLILDGTDNFETRYLINDYAVSHRIPWIYGAAVGSYGLTLPVLPDETACLRCLYRDPPSGAQPTCDTAGVLGSLTTLIGALQVSAAMKILVGQAAELYKGLTTVDVWSGRIRQLNPPPRDPSCPCCGPEPNREFLAGDRRTPVSLCGRNAVQIHLRNSLDLSELASRLAPLAPVKANEFALRFFPDTYEITVFPDGRAIIKGTQDIPTARSLYARYIGS